MKHLNKLLKILSLGLLLPLIGIPEGDSSNKDDSNKDDSNKDGKSNDGSEDSGHDDSKNDDSVNDDNKSFTSKDVNKIVGDRLEREKVKIEKQIRAEVEEEKRKEKLTKEEKLKEEKNEAEKKASEIVKNANKKLVLAEVKSQSVGLNIIDGDAAYSLMEKDDIEVDDDGNVKGVKESLEKLIENKKYLVRSSTKDDENKNVGDDQQGKGNKGKSLDMNQLIRKSAGY